jgi:pimeloyl-ACP methyl ester carboxylesterase
VSRQQHLALIDGFYNEMWNRFDTSVFPEILWPAITFRGSLGQEIVGLDQLRHVRRAGYAEPTFGEARGLQMATYVLVHGAWSGAHGFHLVRPLLHAEGHEVFTPSLTGIGERVHLVSPQVNLTTHITDVVNQVIYEDLDDIVLLGFSYGGMVVTGSLEHIAPRVSHLVYLDAFVPGDGDSLLALLGQAEVSPIGLGEPWLAPPSPREFDDPAEAAFATPRRVPHPIACFTERVRLRQPLEDFPFTRTYIRATADVPDAPGTAVFDAAAARARNSAAWQYHEIATNHMIPNNRPKELAALLLPLA